ncbi:MAG: 16S rRNA (adenine(1518)-N(6)/adenine(1519)-N(6))-dimethyltransferase RsmA [Xanthomonadales bacterium]|nr:16S rRNA (adenine(1518)-N(6)/adenine(1519)-N(6))-dimethyltransferase RsmA [Xanthomonadales bacterium]
MKHVARKRFGQNFLVDTSVIDRICSAMAPNDGELIVEIGPGQGAMTRPLLESGAEVLAVEIDRDLASALQQELGALDSFRVVQCDALKTDMQQLTADRPYRIAGNLPYNISTPLLFHVLGQAHQPQDMHFMLQQEVVDRLGARAGSRQYGRLSVMCQNRCEVEPLFGIGPAAFRPAPRVHSALVRLLPRPEPLSGTGLEAALDQVVRTAFAQRRKTVRNALSGLLDESRISEAGVDPGTRPEQVDIAQFIALARQIRH